MRFEIPLRIHTTALHSPVLYRTEYVSMRTYMRQVRKKKKRLVAIITFRYITTRFKKLNK